MVDAQAGAAGPGIPEVTSKMCRCARRAKHAQGVGPALRNEVAEGGAHFRREQGIIEPALRLVDMSDLDPHDLVVVKY